MKWKARSLLARTQNTILSAAFVLFVANSINSVLGFLKSRLLAHYFGVSRELAIFYTADRIPNLIYSILVVGAVSTVFIPVFTDLLRKDKEKAFDTASSIINVTLIFFFVLAGVIFILAPSVMRLLSLGKFSNEEVQLGASLMRIMLGSQLLLVGGSLATSILQSFKHFLVPALAPVFYNLGMLGGIVFLSKPLGIYGPTIGVVIGALLHITIQLPLVKKMGFHFSLLLNLRDKGFLRITRLVPPRLLSVLLNNLLATINNSLAILVSASSVVFLKFATQLQSFPVSLFGLTIATASLPTLSEETDENQLEQFKKTFLTSLHQMLFLVIPTSVILLVLRVPVVRIVYGVSNFPWEATIKTAYVLAFFSLSVFAQSTTYLITRAFYALKDTITPVKVSLITIVLNLSMSLFFILKLGLGVWSVALSFSITSIIDMLAMLYLLNKKVGGFNLPEILIPFIKTSYAAVLMGITLYVPMKLLDIVVLDTSRVINLLVLTGIAGISGTATYLFFTWLFKVEEIELFYKVVRRLNFAKNHKLHERTQYMHDVHDSQN
jgi:putative peptidoglycan lipid II flippase